MGALIKYAEKGSIAEEAGIEKGDVLLSINGQEIVDILSYRFLSSSEEITLEIQKKNNDIEVIEVFNEDYDDIGIEFENGLIDEPKSCRNKCMFCFVDQLPKNMRKTLYFKDDDYRLSTLMGNYITLTNLSENDIERIIQMRLPRINVSVHTVDAELRKRMLSNKNSEVLSIMKRFADRGITMNCQIVLCKDINDGVKLDETINALSSLYPHVKSVCVVPVGLTSHRSGLAPLKQFDSTSAKEVINQLKKHQQKLLDKLKTRFVFPSDEFYVCANLPLPSFEEYEDFLQIENGVGLIASLFQEFKQAKRNRKHYKISDNISIATGVSAAPFIQELVNMLGNNNINVYPIKNTFFGKSITVAGLITGGDLISQLSDKALGETLLIPRCMLNTDELFLDDVTISDVENALNIKLRPIENDGYKLFDALIYKG